MTLHRFFVPPTSAGADHVTFSPDQARQMQRVLRLRPGDRVIALDGTGKEYVVTLQDGFEGRIEETRRNTAEPSLTLTLYQGVLKGAKLELVLQKCTEIGVDRFVPVTTARAVPADPSPSRQRRFETIVREAAEQSRRGCVPAIEPAIDLAQALQCAAANGPIVLLWEEGGCPLRQLTCGPAPSTLSLFVGPEGGFSEEEVELARRGGAQIATLGPRILRSETAAIVGAALLLARYDGGG